MKKVFLILIPVVIIGFVFFSNNYYQKKLENNALAFAQTFKEKEEQAEKERIEKEAKEQEKRQAIFNKHKGEKLLYFAMGDSLAVGANATSEDKGYVRVLSSQIEKNMGYKVTVDKSTVKSGTGLKDNGIVNIQNSINANPDFITIEFGNNDWNPDLAAYSTPEEFESNLTTIVKKLIVNTDAEILLVKTWNIHENYEAFNSIIDSVGEKFNVPVVDIKDVWRRNDTYSTSDNWHPNDLGHQLIAEKIFEVAYEILQ